MRINSGKLGGRIIYSPNTRSTRPMTDKVRGALFDILGPIDGFMVLDAYAGSGALGFESISRGADRVIAIESGKQAINAITKNVAGLDLGFQYQLVPSKVESWLARKPDYIFDLIFFMPPYSIFDREIAERVGSLLGQDGTLVIEFSRQQTPAELEHFRLVQARDYGDQKLAFYQRRT